MEENYEVTQQEENTNTEQLPNQEENSTTQATQQSADSNPNFRNLRTAKERLEQENRELQNRLKQIEESQSKAKESQYDPDDLVERRYVDDRLSRYEKEMRQFSTEYKLKSNYPDFDKVVNEHTISLLKEKNPTLAMALGQVGDEYSKAAGAYEAIKNLNLYNEDKYAGDRERAQTNSSTPRPLQSISPQKGDSAIGKANAFASGMNDDYKKELWKEMQAAMKAPRD